MLMLMVLASTLDTNDVDGCQHDCEGVTQRCFREFWEEPGLRVRVLVPRERVIANIRMSQDAEGPQHETVVGFEDRRQPSKPEKLGRGEIRRHGERRWITVVAREKL